MTPTLPLPALGALPVAEAAAAGRRWLRTHQGSVRMAGLVAFAAPVTLLAGDLSVMRAATARDMLALATWWLLYGVELWALLLVVGHAGVWFRWPRRPGLRRGLQLLCLVAAVAGVSASTAERAAVLVAHGVVPNALVMHVYAICFTLAMATLYMAHLTRSRRHEAAATRLAAAQAAQREARRRIAQARLQAVQARIDPRLLFDHLDEVRRSYALDPLLAERQLDELVAFLRLALPRLRNASSSVAREAELALAYIRLRTTDAAHSAGPALRWKVDPQAGQARFPPGVLLPLLEGVLKSAGGHVQLRAHCEAGRCRVQLGLPARPADAVLSRVRGLLADLHGPLAELRSEAAGDATQVTVELPHEPA